MKKELYARVNGRVQLVMYRDFVKRNARALGLVGYVKNLPDGSVEVVAQGKEESLLKLIERMHHGSLLSHVDDIAIEWNETSIQFAGFDIVYA